MPAALSSAHAATPVQPSFPSACVRKSGHENTDCILRREAAARRKNRPDPCTGSLHRHRRRKSKSDINRIAKNTGFSEEEIAAIRAHVFEEKHNLSGGFKHFDPSAKIALAWQRLERADFTELDILLLQHELEELTIMKETGYGYDKAHLLANEKYPWEYKEKGGFTDEQIREINAKRLKNLL